MTILYQTYPVKDQKIIIKLPDSFSATTAEVIVLPLPQTQPLQLLTGFAGRDEQATISQQFLTRDTTQFTTQQAEAYQRICEMLRQQAPAGAPRIAGLFAGFIQITDNFDDPLPDEQLFLGQDTDEYGLTLANEPTITDLL